MPNLSFGQVFDIPEITYSNKLEGADVVSIFFTQPTICTTETQVPEYDLYMAGNTSWLNAFDYIKLDNIIQVDVDHEENLHAETFTYRFIIESKGVDQTVHNPEVYKISKDTLIISYNPEGLTQYKETDAVMYQGFYKVIAKILSIDKLSNDGLTWESLTASTIVPKFIFKNSIRAQVFSKESIPIVNVLNLNTSFDASKNELNFVWSSPLNSLTGNPQTPQLFELQWLFVDCYAKDGTDIPQAGVKYDFSTGFSSVIVSENHYSLPLLYERGYIVYRIRRIRPTSISNFNTLIYSNWTLPFNAGSLIDISDVNYAGGYLKYFEKIVPFEQDNFNWTSTINFAEWGKKKHVVGLFDGSLKNRQTLTKFSTHEDIVLVTSQQYDFSGKPSLQLLPTPIDKAKVGFVNNLWLGNGTNGTFGANNFDQIECTPIGVSNYDPNSLGNGYFSKQGALVTNFQHKNFNQFVPDAEGYPFIQTIYTPDQTGRVKFQGGAGPTFQINGALGRYTTMYYSQATQKELDRIFGIESEKAFFVKKIVTQDPNGQLSVTYVNQAGKNIATALMANTDNSNPLIPLPSSSGTNFQTDDVLENGLKTMKGPYEAEITKNFFIERPNATFQYILQESEILVCSEPPRPSGDAYCYDCVYLIEVKLVDECGELKINEQFEVTFSSSEAQLKPLNHQPNEEILFNETVVLPIGNYQISRKFVVPYQAAYDRAIDFVDHSSIPYDESCVYDEFHFIKTEVDKIVVDCSDDDCEKLRQEMIRDFMPGALLNEYPTSSSAPFFGTNASSVLNLLKAIYTPGNSIDFMTCFGIDPIIFRTIYRNGQSYDHAFLTNAIANDNYLSILSVFDETWAEDLIPLHPKYCIYKDCLNGGLARDNKKVKMIYEYVQNTLTSYTKAENALSFTNLDLDNLSTVLLANNQIIGNIAPGIDLRISAINDYLPEPTYTYFSTSGNLTVNFDEIYRQQAFGNISGENFGNLGFYINTFWNKYPENVNTTTPYQSIYNDRLWRIYKNAILAELNKELNKLNLLSQFGNSPYCDSCDLAQSFFPAYKPLTANTIAGTSFPPLPTDPDLNIPPYNLIQPGNVADINTLLSYFDQVNPKNYLCLDYREAWKNYLTNYGKPSNDVTFIPCTVSGPTLETLTDQIAAVSTFTSTTNATDFTLDPMGFNKYSVPIPVREFWENRVKFNGSSSPINAPLLADLINDIIDLNSNHITLSTNVQLVNLGVPSNVVEDMLSLALKPNQTAPYSFTNCFFDMTPDVSKGEVLIEFYHDLTLRENVQFLVLKLKPDGSSQSNQDAFNNLQSTSSVISASTNKDIILEFYRASNFELGQYAFELEASSPTPVRNYWGYNSFFRVGESLSIETRLNNNESTALATKVDVETLLTDFDSDLTSAGLKFSFNHESTIKVLSNWGAYSGWDIDFENFETVVSNYNLGATHVLNNKVADLVFYCTAAQLTSIQNRIAQFNNINFINTTILGSQALTDGEYYSINYEIFSSVSGTPVINRVYLNLSGDMKPHKRIILLNYMRSAITAAASRIYNRDDVFAELYWPGNVSLNFTKSNSSVSGTTRAFTYYRSETGTTENINYLPLTFAPNTKNAALTAIYHDIQAFIQANPQVKVVWHRFPAFNPKQNLTGLELKLVNYINTPSSTLPKNRFTLAEIKDELNEDPNGNTVNHLFWYHDANVGNEAELIAFKGQKNLEGDLPFVTFYEFMSQSIAPFLPKFSTHVGPTPINWPSPDYNKEFFIKIADNNQVWIRYSDQAHMPGKRKYYNMYFEPTFIINDLANVEIEWENIIPYPVAGGRLFKVFARQLNSSGGTIATGYLNCFADFDMFEYEIIPAYFLVDATEEKSLYGDTISCMRSKFLAAEAAGKQYYQTYREAEINAFITNYRIHCVNTFTDKMNATLDRNQYHYTLYYYDQAGNLERTIPPKGVKLYTDLELQAIETSRRDNFNNTYTSFVNPTTGNRAVQHTFESKYTYNSLGQIATQKTPDGGTSKFLYDHTGRLVFSQNQQQTENSRLSYTRYDNLGRIIEVGELHLTGLVPSEFTNQNALYEISPIDLDVLIRNRNRYQATVTYYDNETLNMELYGYSAQSNLRNRVVTTAYFEEIAPDLGAQPLLWSNATHYSYDAQGNVKDLYQEVPKLAVFSGQQFKHMHYEYELLSGNVISVAYQRGKADQFYHRYNYDADNRITLVETSPNGVLWDQDAKYDYYLHGPLARVNLGEHKVQGKDYAYTLNGWLKAINSDIKNPSLDMGKDGIFNDPNEIFGTPVADAYGMGINYFNGDYKGVGTNGTTNINVTHASGLNADNLYNGNITAITQHTHNIEQMAVLYTYDQLNRLLETQFIGFQSSASINLNTAGTQRYKESFAYDPNGNILSLTRNNGNPNTPQTIDDLTYHYSAGNNMLQQVTDPISSSFVNYDIDNQNKVDNYIYDAIGNLVTDQSEGLSIQWNVYGKVNEVYKALNGNSNRLRFQYNASGQRLAKTVHVQDAFSGKTEYYIRDAQGNVMATYSIDSVISGTPANYLYVLTALEEAVSRADVNDLILDNYGSNESFILYLSHGIASNTALYTAHMNGLDVEDILTVGPTLLDQLITINTAGFGEELFNNHSYEIAITMQNCANLNFIRKLWDEDVSGQFFEMICTNHPDVLEQLLNIIELTTSSNCGDDYLNVLQQLNNLDAEAKTYFLQTILDAIHTNAIDATNVADFFSNNATTIAGYTNFIEFEFRKLLIDCFEEHGGLTPLVSAATNLFSLNDLETIFGKRLLAEVVYKSNKLTTINNQTIEFLANVLAQIPNLHVDDLLRMIKARDIEFETDVYSELVENLVLETTSRLALNEHHIYGSSRLGVKRVDNSMLQVILDGSPVEYEIVEEGIDEPSYPYAGDGEIYLGQPTPFAKYRINKTRGYKQYELTNHLGNVMVTLSDRKVGIPNTAQTHYTSYTADVYTAQEYFAFGSPIEERKFSGGDGYRYGFNGKEFDKEWNSGGAMYDYGFRIYDPRLGKFLSVDPLTKDYPHYTPYQFAGNMPIWALDLDGLEEQIFHYFRDVNGYITSIKLIRIVEQDGRPVNADLTYKGKNYKDSKVLVIEQFHDGTEQVRTSNRLSRIQRLVINDTESQRRYNSTRDNKIFVKGAEAKITMENKRELIVNDTKIRFKSFEFPVNKDPTKIRSVDYISNWIRTGRGGRDDNSFPIDEYRFEGPSKNKVRDIVLSNLQNNTILENITEIKVERKNKSDVELIGYEVDNKK